MLLRCYSNLVEIAGQKSSTLLIVCLTLRANKIFVRSYWVEGGRCCTVTAIRYDAGGINARGQDKNS
jgi:hypothetical protein